VNDKFSGELVEWCQHTWVLAREPCVLPPVHPRAVRVTLLIATVATYADSASWWATVLVQLLQTHKLSALVLSLYPGSNGEPILSFSSPFFGDLYNVCVMHFIPCQVNSDWLDMECSVLTLSLYCLFSWWVSGGLVCLVTKVALAIFVAAYNPPPLAGGELPFPLIRRPRGLFLTLVGWRVCRRTPRLSGSPALHLVGRIAQTHCGEAGQVRWLWEGLPRPIAGKPTSLLFTLYSLLSPETAPDCDIAWVGNAPEHFVCVCSNHFFGLCCYALSLHSFHSISTLFHGAS